MKRLEFTPTPSPHRMLGDLDPGDVFEFVFAPNETTIYLKVRGTGSSGEHVGAVRFDAKDGPVFGWYWKTKEVRLLGSLCGLG